MVNISHKARIRVLEKDLAEEKKSVSQREMLYRKHISNIDILREDMRIAQEQVRTCQQHLTQLNQKSECHKTDLLEC